MLIYGQELCAEEDMDANHPLPIKGNIISKKMTAKKKIIRRRTLGKRSLALHLLALKLIMVHNQIFFEKKNGWKEK
jgi:hypothetical protein